MKRYIFSLLLSLSIPFFLVVCCSSCNTNKHEVGEELLAEMKPYAIKSAADEKAVSKLLSFSPSFHDHFKLEGYHVKLDNGHYSLILLYESIHSNNKKPITVNPDMEIFANYLFECIGDLQSVEYAYRKKPADKNDTTHYQQLKVYKKSAEQPKTAS